MAAYTETYDTTQPIETYKPGDYDFNGEYAKSYLLQHGQMKIGQTYRGYLDLKIAELVGKQQEMQDCIGDIADTIFAIIRNTGWDYAVPTVMTTTFENYMESGTFFNHYGFYLVSNPNSLSIQGIPYTYSDIAFQIETIETSPKKEEFLRCAGKNYNRLKKLEDNRQSIIKEAIAKYGEAEIRKIVTDLKVQKAPNSIYDSSDFFQRTVKHMEEIENLSDKIRQEAHMFATRYSKEGINHLIYLLEIKENSSDPIQAIEYLNSFKRDSEPVTQDEIIETIRWAAALSNKARIWEESFAKEFGKVGSILDQESYERVMREKSTESVPLHEELVAEEIPEDYKQLATRFLEAKHTNEEMNRICQLLNFLCCEPKINIVEWFNLVVLGDQEQPTEEETNVFVALCMYANCGMELYKAYSRRYVEQKTDGGKVKEKKADKS